MAKHKEYVTNYATFRKIESGWKLVLHPAPVDGDRWFLLKVQVPDELIGDVIEAAAEPGDGRG